MSWLLAVVVFLFPLAYSPGPGNTYFAAAGATVGFRRSLGANFGYHLATFLMTLLIGCGIGLTLLTDPTVSRILGLVGAAYVLWLGLKSLYSALKTSTTEKTPIKPTLSFSFINGALLLVLNPKGYLIMALLFTQFPGPPGDVGYILLLSTIFTVNNIIAFMVWTLIGQGLARLFQAPAGTKAINIGFSLLLILVALWLLSNALHL